MRSIYAFLICLACALCATSLAAQDAAIEAQEGDVEHWIEYYKKERGFGNETVTEDLAAPQDETPAADETKADSPPAPTPAPPTAD